MICAECGDELEKSYAPIETAFRGTMVVVEGVEHFVCRSCSEVFFNGGQADDFADAVDAAYRRANGLLAPDEIRRIRKQLRMNQDEFQSLLGVGKTTVSRWESGRIIQSKSTDNLIRLAAASRDNVELLRKSAAHGNSFPVQASARSEWAGRSKSRNVTLIGLHGER
ncbi:type II TA system antitoxin MqsA family protein [Gordonibacter sp. Marseille-P4307]|uniref:type II TA system antitoxin MqsA family protein n=1 Tax=Gordonibacter sp. Marseille-P4307 TaxID=2161815 RepID=UPI000F54C418|nr:type II TA system antitoxin MqsA family protein [Gordonibacter sp. Marseille-P4307]